jgi:hypothetical protein
MNGKMINSQVEKAYKDKDGNGVSYGNETGKSLLTRYSQGLNLIGFAGMKYGLDVEAGTRGRPKDVIAGAILLTKNIAKTLFK